MAADGGACASPSAEPSGPYSRAEVSAEVAALKDLDLHELRIRWRKVFRSSAPSHLPRYLLLRIIAYKIQANAYGDLDRETARYLDRIAKDHERRRVAGEIRLRKNPPLIPPVPDKRSLKLGTILAREHEGVLHRVIVVEGGFAWNDKKYKSLSEVAHAITGTNWNGPRFFGLRDRKGPEKPDSNRREARPRSIKSWVSESLGICLSIGWPGDWRRHHHRPQSGRCRRGWRVLDQGRSDVAAIEFEGQQCSNWKGTPVLSGDFGQKVTASHLPKARGEIPAARPARR